jgi:tRNA modification GTPase
MRLYEAATGGAWAGADLLAIDLQGALAFLGDIIGETTTDDVLDMIFAEFCLGK